MIYDADTELPERPTAVPCGVCIWRRSMADLRTLIEVKAMAARIDRLEEALRPFAEGGRCACMPHGRGYCSYCKARAALAEQEAHDSS